MKTKEQILEENYIYPPYNAFMLNAMEEYAAQAIEAQILICVEEADTHVEWYNSMFVDQEKLKNCTRVKLK